METFSPFRSVQKCNVIHFCYKNSIFGKKPQTFTLDETLHLLFLTTLDEEATNLTERYLKHVVM